MTKNKKKNGFTLIELLAVIIILGVLMLLAVPLVSESIIESRNNIYVSNAKSIINTVRTKVNDLSLGVIPNDENAVIVPLENIPLEKGNTKSPYGNYELDKCYVTVTKEDNKYVYYITLVDSSGRAIYGIEESELDASDITKNASITEKISSLTEIKEGGEDARHTSSEFSFKYIKHTDEAISVKIVYKVYARTDEVALIDGTKWFVLSYNDTDEDKFITLLSYDKMVENTSAKVEELADFGPWVEEYRNRLISGGVDLKNATTRFPTFEDICPVKKASGVIDTRSCITDLAYPNDILIDDESGMYRISGGNTVTGSVNSARGEVHILLEIEKVYIEEEDE